MLRSLRFLALVAVSLSIAACSSGDPEDPVDMTEPPPTFRVNAVPTVLPGNQPALQFLATPDTEVKLIRVDLTTPLGDRITFDPQGVVVLGGERTPLQVDNFAYFRISGDWMFRFVGERAAGSRATFDVTTSLPVAAVQEDRPEPEIVR